MNNDQTNAESGFSLLEMLVALATLSISLAFVLGAFSDGLTRIRENEAQSLASAHAQSLLAAAGVTQPLADGETSGAFQGGFRWHMQVSAYGDASDAEAWAAKARQITATIRWQAGGTEKLVRLTTLRLLPREPAP